ncbi:type II toxin-antitoxin system RelE/ParE family toxin [Phreatobacter sp. AB_2022a]|uniref:type II toxin-antitoxin system RelE/ParE family toxin n=1 Tax=Phreatobacter sp. AB_2022a TaxID=3003134 RepID=UPI003FA7D15C
MSGGGRMVRQRRWSTDQAGRYIDDIRDACRGLADGRKRGQKVAIRAGYTKFAVGAHLLFYRVEDGVIGIVRIPPDEWMQRRIWTDRGCDLCLPVIRCLLGSSFSHPRVPAVGASRVSQANPKGEGFCRRLLKAETGFRPATASN